MTETLTKALRLENPGIVALIGAGGKTTLMYTLARELAARGAQVITTTTTHIYPPQKGESPHLLLGDVKALTREIKHLIPQFRHITVARAMNCDGKLLGLDPWVIPELYAGLNDGYIIVEADGARGAVIKALADHEPVIPFGASLVVPVLGLGAVGKPLEEPYAFRSEILSEITGQVKGSIMTIETLLHAIVHPKGLLKAIPKESRVIPFLNQKDLIPEGQTEELAHQLLRAFPLRIHRVVAGDLRGTKPLLKVFIGGKLRDVHEVG